MALTISREVVSSIVTATARFSVGATLAEIHSAIPGAPKPEELQRWVDELVEARILSVVSRSKPRRYYVTTKAASYLGRAAAPAQPESHPGAREGQGEGRAPAPQPGIQPVPPVEAPGSAGSPPAPNTPADQVVSAQAKGNGTGSTAGPAPVTKLPQNDAEPSAPEAHENDEIEAQHLSPRWRIKNWQLTTATYIACLFVFLGVIYFWPHSRLPGKTESLAEVPAKAPLPASQTSQTSQTSRTATLPATPASAIPAPLPAPLPGTHASPAPATPAARLASPTFPLPASLPETPSAPIPTQPKAGGASGGQQAGAAPGSTNPATPPSSRSPATPAAAPAGASAVSNVSDISSLSGPSTFRLPPSDFPPGAYVPAGDRWVALPRNNGHAVATVMPVTSAKFGNSALQHAVEAGRSADGKTATVTELVFDGTDAVPAVASADLMIALVGTLGAPADSIPSSPDGVRFAAVELAPLVTLPVGVRSLVLLPVAPHSHRSASGVVATTLEPAAGKITLLRCVRPPAPGRYAVLVGEQAYEVAVE